ncbi:hypothetical protein [Leifsonia sp. EB34]|uniref:hypothetical protein n=1 Tax=Leifsonia sp. EB34 TaxID=3156303 RepID=UPI0035167289
MGHTMETQITLIRTLPTASRRGTVNGVPMLLPEWQDLSRKLREMTLWRADQLASKGVREVEVYQGRTIFTLHTPAATMDTMARAVVSHLARPEQIGDVWAQPSHAVVWVTSTDGEEIYAVVDLNAVIR